MREAATFVPSEPRHFPAATCVANLDDRSFCVPAAPDTQQILQRAKPADDPGESANGAEEALAARKVGDLVGVHVIPRPADDVGQIFPIVRHGICDW